MSQIINILIMAFIIFVVIAYFAYLLLSQSKKEKLDDLSRYTIENLQVIVKDQIDQALRMNLRTLGLSEDDIIKQTKLKTRRIRDLESCSSGDLKAKNEIINYINDILQVNEDIPVNADTINRFIHFDDPTMLTVEQKFDILLYWYKKFYRYKAFKKLAEQFDWLVPRIDAQGEYYDVDTQMVEEAYDDVCRSYGSSDRKSKVNSLNLNYMDKIMILSYEVYKNFKGLGVVDEIVDMNIDGVNCGVNGTPFGLFELVDGDHEGMQFTFNSVWVQLSGKYVHLSCLGFGRQEELVRVCKLIYKYKAPAQLSEAQGCVVTTRKDGSRLVTVRPPFSSSWAFVLRKPGSSLDLTITDAIKDQGADIVISAMACIIKSCRSVVVTGEQGSGKTTLLRLLVQFIRQTYTIRTQEMIFELFLNEIYPARNIIAMKETDTIDCQAGVNYGKKMDGQVTILGEVAEAKLATLLIQLTQVASLQTMCTHHAKTTQDFVIAIRDNLVKTGDCPNVEIAELTVASTLNFDIHQVRTRTGDRYIERVTEIIPLAQDEMPTELEANTIEYHNRMVQPHCFITRDIVRYVKHPAGSETKGHYELVNKISKEKQRAMSQFLSDEEKATFAGLFELPWSEVSD